jgi:hypothetical protein
MDLGRGLVSRMNFATRVATGNTPGVSLPSDAPPPGELALRLDRPNSALLTFVNSRIVMNRRIFLKSARWRCCRLALRRRFSAARPRPSGRGASC